jgi:hypothetical protein
LLSGFRVHGLPILSVYLKLYHASRNEKARFREVAGFCLLMALAVLLKHLGERIIVIHLPRLAREAEHLFAWGDDASGRILVDQFECGRKLWLRIAHGESPVIKLSACAGTCLLSLFRHQRDH